VVPWACRLGGTVPAPSTPYLLFSNPDDIRAKADQLVGLVRSGPGTRPLGPGTWKGWIGPAMLLKAAGTLESMILLMPARSTVDAMSLLRTLFENTVTFSWIAIDPGDRVTAWYRTSCYWELQEHLDWEKAGRGLRTSAEAEELRIQAGSKSDGLPGVPTMAAKADEHWGALVPGWSPTSSASDPGVFSSLRGLYRYIYQRGSAAAHSRARGLDLFVTFDGDRVAVHPEKPASDYHPYALGLYTLAFAIMASEQSLAWPSWRQAARILQCEAAVFGSESRDDREGASPDASSGTSGPRS